MKTKYHPLQTIPKGIRLVEAAPKLNAMGKAPKDVAKLVIKTGLNRCVAAYTTTASFFNSFPRF